MRAFARVRLLPLAPLVHLLNDTRIRNAKPAERDYKLTDFDGLYLLMLLAPDS